MTILDRVRTLADEGIYEPEEIGFAKLKEIREILHQIDDKHLAALIHAQVERGLVGSRIQDRAFEEIDTLCAEAQGLA